MHAHTCRDSVVTQGDEISQYWFEILYALQSFYYSPLSDVICLEAVWMHPYDTPMTLKVLKNVHRRWMPSNTLPKASVSEAKQMKVVWMIPQNMLLLNKDLKPWMPSNSLPMAGAKGAVHMEACWMKAAQSSNF